jgi:peptide chain release factor
VRATHNETGISVRVESERSQHANKRLARALLFQKLEMMKQEQMTSQEKAHWQQHGELERGNPVKTFKGEKFVPVTRKSH